MRLRFLLPALLSASCGFGQLQLNYVNGSEQAPITNGQYSFGTVSAGDSRDVQFALVNTGSSDTQLTTLSVNTPFSILYGPSLPQTVPAGGSVTFTISFAPTSGGSFSSTLTADGVSVTLVGTGIPAVQISSSCGTGAPIALDPGASIAFGSVAQGATAACLVVLTNPMLATLTVQNIAVVNTEGNSFQMQPITLPLSLATGVSATLEVDFTPTSGGPQQGTLEIDQRSISLTGMGQGASVPQPVIAVVIPQVASSQQGTLSVNLSSPAQSAATGEVQMSFTSANAGANADKGMMFVSTSNQTVPFNVNPGGTSAEFGTSSSVTFQTGTTAGTILFTVTLGTFTETSSLVIGPASPGIDSTKAQYTSGGLSVQLTGFDNARSASSIVFTFLDANGNTIGGGPITADSTSAFQQFFAASDEGGLFALTAFFPVTAGKPQQVSAVEIQITNSVGTTPTQKIYFTQ